ncbi:MAG: FAD-dependent oxidoreductase [Candidatus Infernicultor aquiphilus]|uniref:FAD-dependent oxidoreductase n=1 Tax=Candidatus Infernicultor aquiphilus TaxID=1805029 RepID=A0A2M8CAM0_9BACT|nr:FAD-binding oxidoreductase [bacterium]PIX33375.1 MAG: FAD-dependent oxidoreductase [Candidatus Atribacteria bacterium CG_4_8_14_3_um_filter_34_18]PIY32611.1 MAG: FAD-dependent oxidoreductase [Candidatus Atribacteria bacterium CG_4_10_14_3_um_filter_34_13]PJB56103.1 MAG: FAD-dependent oxidoreductase [Candidatus Atribacteria bacterium CG_4_9_14_3_um_filter_33_16]
MIKKADLVIIGGGVVGCSVAYNLAKLGAKNIILLEKNTLASGSTGRCGAGIRQQFGTKMNCILARESIKIFENLSQELEYDIELNQGGYLILAYTEKEVNQFKKNVALEQSLNIKARFITVEEAKEIVPPLNTEGILAATFCPTDGHANPFKTNFAYAEAAERLGVKIYTFTEVKEIETENHKIVAVNTDKGKLLTPMVVNAAGGYSGIIGKMVGVDIPVYSQRHQILITEPIDPLFRPMLMSFSRNFYGQQTPHGSIIMGFGDPNERKDGDIGSSWQFAQEMAQKMTAVLPLLKEVSMVRQWAGLYNMSPDAQPILGEHPQIEGFYMALGFSGHGFMLAPITSKLIAELILKRKTSLPIDKLDIGRFERGELIIEPSVV